MNIKDDNHLFPLIIVAEDDKGLLRLIQKKLQGSDLKTRGTAYGAEAIPLIKKHQNSLLLLDYRLLDMTGTKLIKSLMAEQISVPFIIMTGQGNEKIAVEMMKLGARDYLVKDNQFMEILPNVVKKALKEICTEKRLQEAEEKLRKLSHAVEQGSASVIITDKEGTIEYVNTKFTKVTGYSIDEIIGKNPRILNSRKQSKEFYQDLWSTITSGKEWRGDFCNKKKNRELFWESASISPIKNEKGTITHFVAVKEDITFRKLAEEELIQAKDKLEQRVQERTQELTSIVKSLNMEVEMRREVQIELKKAMVSAEKANRAKSDFLANMSHDLRTPLNAILGYVQILKGGQFQPELLSKALDTIHRSGEHLLNLINDILDLSKIESGKIELIPGKFSFPDFLQNIADIMMMRAQQKKINFQLKIRGTVPSIVYIDGKRLREILINLIDNAIKYTPNGKVIFEVGNRKTRQRETNSENIRFRVWDTGIGISKDKLEKIFKPFFRLEEIHSNVTGTGLGLTISKRLVSLMGGDLCVKTILGKGSIFQFKLNVPVVCDNKRKSSPRFSQISRYKGPRRKIMIVDDNRENREVFESLLEALGFKICEVSGGQECLDRLDEFYPELIFMDLQMPKMNGFEATRKIREQGNNVIIIAASATASQSNRQKSKMAGCDDFIAKPIAIEEVQGLISLHLKLEWNHKKNIRNNKNTFLNVNPKQMLPEKILKQLIQYADMGNPARFLKELEKLNTLENKYTLFVKKLDHMATDFKFQELIQILKG